MPARVNKIARLRLRVIDKATRRTGVAFYPWEGGITFGFYTGEMRLITDKAGYSEYNDRGQPVLDSWMEPIQYLVMNGG